MSTHLGLQRIMVPGTQVSSLTEGSVISRSARSKTTTTAQDCLATITLSAETATIYLGAISQEYSNLEIWVFAKTSHAGGEPDVWFTFNDDTSANYTQSYHAYYLNTVSNGSTANASNIPIGYNFMPRSGISNVFGFAKVIIPDYSNPNKYKTLQSIGGAPLVSGATYGWVNHNSGHWRSNEPIRNITISATSGFNFASGTQITLFGVK